MFCARSVSRLDALRRRKVTVAFEAVEQQGADGMAALRRLRAADNELFITVCCGGGGSEKDEDPSDVVTAARARCQAALAADGVTLPPHNILVHAQDASEGIVVRVLKPDVAVTASARTALYLAQVVPPCVAACIVCIGSDKQQQQQQQQGQQQRKLVVPIFYQEKI